LSVRTAEGASEKQSSLKARLRNGLTYLLTYLLTCQNAEKQQSRPIYSHYHQSGQTLN